MVKQTLSVFYVECIHHFEVEGHRSLRFFNTSIPFQRLTKTTRVPNLPFFPLPHPHHLPLPFSRPLLTTYRSSSASPLTVPLSIFFSSYMLVYTAELLSAFWHTLTKPFRQNSRTAIRISALFGLLIHCILWNFYIYICPPGIPILFASLAETENAHLLSPVSL